MHEIFHDLFQGPKVHMWSWKCPIARPRTLKHCWENVCPFNEHDINRTSFKNYEEKRVQPQFGIAKHQEQHNIKQ
jgi:hypothetical protein